MSCGRLMVYPILVAVVSISNGDETTATGGGSERGLYRSENSLLLKPFFDNVDTNNINVSAVQGRAGLLTCTVRNLGNRTVSWIRHESHTVVLSSGSVIFTSDSRVHVNNEAGTDHWILSINNVMAKDQGIYKCQVNTEPKINLSFLLNIVQCRREDRIIYTGNTIDSDTVEGEEACDNWCRRISECRVWTLSKSTNRCRIMSSVSGRRDWSGVVSGTKGCTTVSDEPFCVVVDCSLPNAENLCPIKCSLPKDPEFCGAVDCSHSNSHTFCPIKCPPPSGVTNLGDVLAEMSLLKIQIEQLTTKVELHDSLLSSLQMTFTQDSLLSSPQPSICSSYSELTDSWRRLQYDNRGSFPYHCDQSGSDSFYTQLTTSWYRFTGAAGSKLPTAPAPGGPPTSDKLTCGTFGVPYIFSGGNPTKQEGIVTRDLCWEYGSNSCYWKSTVKVAACNDAQGDYFVYELQPVPSCNYDYFAYCAIP